VAVVIELDARVFRALHDAMSGSLVLAAMALFTALGSGWSMLGLAPLVAAPRTRRFAVALLTVLTTTSLAVVAIKLVVRRVRPYASLPGIHARVFAAPTDFSFPSGHAAGSFAFATFVALVLLRGELRLSRMLIAFVLYVLAAGIALSRVALGVHFPGDIAAGAALGVVVGGAGALVYRKGLAIVG